MQFKRRNIVIPNRDQYYDDIEEIAMTTLIDGETIYFANKFLLESSELLKKAIVIFEENFFDCAFYLLRSSIELLLTLVYLIELPYKKRENKLDDWIKIKRFPTRKAMLRQLDDMHKNYAEIKEIAPEIFHEMNQLSQTLNKYTHKQGFDKFYVFRDLFMNNDESKDKLLQEFVKSLESSIRILAVLRIAVDPFPILLMDEVITRKMPNLFTSAYSYEFVNRYIGIEVVNKYKSTNIYRKYFDAWNPAPIQNKFVTNVIHEKYIDSKHINDILKQKELLTLNDSISVLLIACNQKITNIYYLCGFINYISDRKSISNIKCYDINKFKYFEERTDCMNQKYGNAFISKFDFPDGPYLVEHKDKIDKNDYNRIKDRVLNEIYNMEHLREALQYCNL